MLEASNWRALRPGGVLFAAAISRFASLHDGLAQGFVFAPEFADIVATDVVKGTHRTRSAGQGGSRVRTSIARTDLLRKSRSRGSTTFRCSASKARQVGYRTSMNASPMTQIARPSFDYLQKSSANHRSSGRVPISWREP